MRLLTEPVLVGRERELKELTSFLDSAVEGRGKTVFVSGEAGSGKTRLVREFSDIARKNDFTVLMGWCIHNAVVPYFPFIEAFNSYYLVSQAQTSNGRQVGTNQWLTGMNQGGRIGDLSLSPQIWKDQAFAAVTRELLLLSTVKPTVFVIDDLHWADSASLSLLHYVSRALRSERVLVIATFRSEELTVTPEGHPRPLVETLRLMAREELFRQVKLSGLEQDSISKLAKNMLGGNIDKAFVERLTKESLGNPLFIVESLRMLHEQNHLFRENRTWRFHAEKIGIPNKVKDIILARLGVLGSDQRRMLNVASVIGERFEANLLADVIGQEHSEVLEVLNAITQSTSLVHPDQETYKFDHAKSREVLYEEISPVLKKEYHNKIAKRIENSVGAKRLLSDLAYHYTQADCKEKSVKYGIAAGQEALASYGNAEAIKYFTNVLQTAAENPEYANDRKIALEGLGDAFHANCMFKEATATFERLAASETGNARLRVLRKAMDATFFQGDNPGHLMELAKKAEEYAAFDRLESARVRVNRGRALCFLLRNFTAGLKDFEEALRIFEEENSASDAANVLIAIGTVSSIINGLQENGIAATLRSMAMYEDLRDVRGQIDGLLFGADAFFYSGFYQEAWKNYVGVLKIGKKIGDFNRMAQASASMSVLLEAEGNFKDAISRSLKAAEFADKTDIAWISGKIYANLVRQYAECGDSEKAAKYFEKLTKLPNDVLSNTNTSLLFLIARAIFFASRSQVKEANESFEASFGTLRHFRIIPYETIAGRNYVRTLCEQGRGEEAKRITEEIESHQRKLQERFGQAGLYASLTAQKNAAMQGNIELNLIVVNAATKVLSIIGIENLAPQSLDHAAINSFHTRLVDSISMNRKIEPFEFKSIKLNTQTTKSGVFMISPKVIYADETGATRICKSSSVKISVQPAPAAVLGHEMLVSSKVDFKTEATRRAFVFLVDAFAEDYLRRRFSLGASGWRSLSEIVKKARVSKYSVYGSGRLGPVVSEIERSGLIEARIFPGERGRGGRILKLRVLYENEKVKQQLGCRALRAREK